MVGGDRDRVRARADRDVRPGGVGRECDRRDGVRAGSAVGDVRGGLVGRDRDGRGVLADGDRRAQRCWSESVIGTTWPGLPSSAMYAVEPSGVIAIATGFVIPGDRRAGSVRRDGDRDHGVRRVVGGVGGGAVGADGDRVGLGASRTDRDRSACGVGRERDRRDRAVVVVGDERLRAVRGDRDRVGTLADRDRGGRAVRQRDRR